MLGRRGLIYRSQVTRTEKRHSETRPKRRRRSERMAEPGSCVHQLLAGRLRIEREWRGAGAQYHFSSFVEFGIAEFEYMQGGYEHEGFNILQIA